MDNIKPPSGCAHAYVAFLWTCGTPPQPFFFFFILIGSKAESPAQNNHPNIQNIPAVGGSNPEFNSSHFILPQLWLEWMMIISWLCFFFFCPSLWAVRFGSAEGGIASSCSPLAAQVFGILYPCNCSCTLGSTKGQLSWYYRSIKCLLSISTYMWQRAASAVWSMAFITCLLLSGNPISHQSLTFSLWLNQWFG